MLSGRGADGDRCDGDCKPSKGKNGRYSEDSGLYINLRIHRIGVTWQEELCNSEVSLKLIFSKL